ncbi:MAG: glycosyltransferase family 2 protein [Oscillospiraceae bacterium]|nr:glycosyltransferase family 2 protein [Oscillospiraceae bacterium]MDY3064975.1 glycosyltransferase family 2 protein [Oscillospiraceae bacterium]
MEPLISVIIPVYNVESYLEVCIASIVNQTYENLEIILVDDGSPDRCPEICDDWAKRDDRIQVIHKENGGLASARNAGMDICTGEYISFVDSDDWLEKNAYENLLEYFDENTDIVKFNMIRNNDVIPPETTEVKIYEEEMLLNCFLYHWDNMCSSIWDKLYKRGIIMDCRFPSINIHSEDYVMMAQVYSMNCTMKMIDRHFYHYRIRENSICTSPLNEHSFDKIQVADMVCELLQKNGYDNMSGFRYFKMQARHDVLYSLVIRHAPSNLIRQYTHELRKYYWSTIQDKNVSAGFKCKLTLFCIAPRMYEKVKQAIKKR